MIETLFINKRFNAYADTFLILGLARIAAYALNQTKQKTEMQLVDEGTRYRIQFKKPAVESIAIKPVVAFWAEVRATLQPGRNQLETPALLDPVSLPPHRYNHLLQVALPG